MNANVPRIAALTHLLPNRPVNDGKRKEVVGSSVDRNKAKAN